jgi:hypothetical protein
MSDDFALRCIICKIEFSESDIAVMEATDILICDLCAYYQATSEDSIQN